MKPGTFTTAAGCRLTLTNHEPAGVVEVVIVQPDGRSHTFVCRRGEAVAVAALFTDAAKEPHR